MYLIITVILIFVLGIMDASLSSVVAGIIILVVSGLQSQLADKNARQYAFKLNQIVLSGYLIMAYIFSLAFENGSFFAVSDPSRYIDGYSNSRSFLYEWQNIYDCYFRFADNNALYNTYLRAVSIFANNELGGTSVYYLTLAQTLFGILSINVLFRILSRRTSLKTAYKATLSFAFLSVFLFYSCVIVRDVVIAYFFLLAIEIVLKPFSLSGVLKMILLMLLAWGVRLYSGLFMLSFVGLYLYLYAQHTKLRTVALPLFIIIMLVVGAALMGSAILEQTTTEMDLYTEMTMEAEDAKGGLIGSLYRLPPGISQIALTLYSQMAPFPPYLRLATAYSFPSFVMSVCIIAYAVFWFFVFYSIVASFILLRSYKQYGQTLMLLFLIAIIFIIANTSHPDIRRMMPVYPITYLLYIDGRNRVFPLKWLKRTQSTLLCGYVSVLLVYIFIKGI